MHDQPANSILDLYVVDENQIWACQNNGFVFYTLNGGTDWFDIYPNILNANKATAIHATSDGKVWVTGKYVSISYTNDFGSTWTDQIPNIKSTLFQPVFFDQHIGFVGGSDGVVLRTVNGGASYEPILFPVNENFFAADMLTAQVVVIGSSSGNVFGSPDQGNNWIPLGDNLGQITDLDALNAQTVLITNEQGKIYRTTDTGMQWDIVYDDPFVLWDGLDFISPLLGWACGSEGQILKTVDGGANWDLTYADDHNEFSDINFITPQEGWVISSSFTDTIWHSTDGGLSWPSSLLPVKTFWHAVSFTNPDTGWVAGGSAGYGVILRTNNGGQTWTIDHESPEALFGIHALRNLETAWACGIGGNIVKYSPCNILPQLSGLTGIDMPCEKDTVAYSVVSTDVDIFEWSYPSDWLVLGNPNTSVITFIVGESGGEVSITGKDACGNETTPLSLQVFTQTVPDAIITESSGFLECNINAAFYQWYKDGAAIPGANEQSYTPLTSGEYFVVVTLPATGCESRSNSLQIVVSHTGDLNASSLVLYPNPAGPVLNFRFEPTGPDQEEISIGIYDVEGRCKVIFKPMEPYIKLEGMAPGLFIITIKTEQGIWHRMVMHE